MDTLNLGWPLRNRPVLLFLISIVLLSIAGSVSAQPPDQRALSLGPGVEEHKEIDAVYARFDEGYRKLDAVLVAGLYTETAAYLPPGGEVQTGRQKIRENFNGFFDSVRKQNGKLRISFRILQRKVNADLGYDVGIFTLVSTDAGGRSQTSTGKFVVVAVRGKDGVWRFQVDGYNSMQADNR